MPHFKDFLDPTFLSNIDFLDNSGKYVRKIVTIADVKKAQVHSGKGNLATTETTVVTRETKPFVLSNRNFKTLIRATRKPNTDDWKGIRIELFIRENVKAFGEMWDVVTVNPVLPTQTRTVDYSNQTASLRACKTLVELQSVYMAFTADEKAGTLSVKDELKTQLTPDPAASGLTK